jgi:hypothetical protein
VSTEETVEFQGGSRPIGKNEYTVLGKKRFQEEDM